MRNRGETRAAPSRPKFENADFVFFPGFDGIALKPDARDSRRGQRGYFRRVFRGGGAFPRGGRRESGSGRGFGGDARNRNPDLHLELHRCGRKSRSAGEIPDFCRRDPALEEPRPLHGESHARRGKTAHCPRAAAVFREIGQSREHARHGVCHLHALNESSGHFRI